LLLLQVALPAAATTTSAAPATHNSNGKNNCFSKVNFGPDCLIKLVSKGDF